MQWFTQDNFNGRIGKVIVVFKSAKTGELAITQDMLIKCEYKDDDKFYINEVAQGKFWINKNKESYDASCKYRNYYTLNKVQCKNVVAFIYAEDLLSDFNKEFIFIDPKQITIDEITKQEPYYEDTFNIKTNILR